MRNEIDKVYIIIVNYNGWKDTIECLESVFKSDYKNYKVILVDNDSPNNSMGYIKAWADGKQNLIYDENSQLKHLSQPFEPKPIDYVFYTKEQVLNAENISSSTKLVLIQAGENKGFAAGNNIAIKYALKKDDFDYVWLLNNDTVIEKNSLGTIINYAKQNKLGICGSTLMSYDDPKKLQAYGGTVNKFFGTSRRILDKTKINKKLDYVVGASFLIDKKVISTIGLLPEDYFLYYEETDYCFNARQNEFKLGVATNSIVYHKEGGSTKTKSKKKIEEFADLLGLVNRVKFHKKYLGGGIGLWIGMFIAFFNRIRRGQFDRIWKFLRKYK